MTVRASTSRRIIEAARLDECFAAHVSLATNIWLQTMAPLTVGDSVERQGVSRVADGYFAADRRMFWGCTVG
jgi:hypothetical protein